MSMPTSPTPEQIAATRKRGDLTQTDATNLLYVTLNGYQKWEYGEREMPAAIYELFQLKVKKIVAAKARKRAAAAKRAKARKGAKS